MSGPPSRPVPNGHRRRDWDTRAAIVELEISKPRRRGYFPPETLRCLIRHVAAIAYRAMVVDFRARPATPKPGFTDAPRDRLVVGFADP